MPASPPLHASLSRHILDGLKATGSLLSHTLALHACEYECKMTIRAGLLIFAIYCHLLEDLRLISRRVPIFLILRRYRRWVRAYCRRYFIVLVFLYQRARWPSPYARYSAVPAVCSTIPHAAMSSGKYYVSLIRGFISTPAAALIWFSHLMLVTRRLMISLRSRNYHTHTYYAIWALRAFIDTAVPQISSVEIYLFRSERT